ncbi:MAG: phosphoenolpyruvate carboxykinase domain-containing protein, partial [Pseudomonadota bacterium]
SRRTTPTAPVAMKPFCGYNFADYWAHWLSFAERSDALPRIFHVNWFRQDSDGRFLWPGFGENLRVLRWIIGRCEGQLEARDTAIGHLPHAADIDAHDLEMAPGALETLLDVDMAGWDAEIAAVGEYLDAFGARVPDRLRETQLRVRDALKPVS